MRSSRGAVATGGRSEVRLNGEFLVGFSSSALAREGGPREHWFARGWPLAAAAGSVTASSHMAGGWSGRAS